MFRLIRRTNSTTPWVYKEIEDGDGCRQKTHSTTPWVDKKIDGADVSVRRPHSTTPWVYKGTDGGDGCRQKTHSTTSWVCMELDGGDGCRKNRNSTRRLLLKFRYCVVVNSLPGARLNACFCGHCSFVFNMILFPTNVKRASCKVHKLLCSNWIPIHHLNIFSFIFLMVAVLLDLLLRVGALGTSITQVPYPFLPHPPPPPPIRFLINHKSFCGR